MFTVLCAPDKFKESVSALEAAQAMAAGAQAADTRVQADVCPVGDGGEGTLDSLIAALGGSIERAKVLGPLGEPRQARYGLAADGRTGIVELAEASGLALVPPDRRDPTRTTTFGTGQLIARLARRGCTSIIVALGGSATCDGGTGLAQALGARFYDVSGRLLAEPLTGGALLRIGRCELPTDLPPLRVACDITNPLCGPSGAAAIYAPQKGATPDQVRLLDQGLAHLAAVVNSQVDADPSMPGAGAAGGAGFGLAAFCGAQLERGVDLVLEAIGFDDRCRVAALVLTGEGRLDAQTLDGKAVGGVAAAAHRVGVRTIAIVGATGPGALACADPSRGGFLQRYVSLSERFGETRALREPTVLIQEVAREIVAAELLSGRSAAGA